MKKICKKLLIVGMAAVMSVSAMAFSACNYFSLGLGGYTLDQNATDEQKQITSQGGWVVEKGEYTYFINGVTRPAVDDEGTALPFEENAYGDAVRSSLMRIKTADIDGANYQNAADKAEVVVPLMLVSNDYEAGIFIHGDYVYYATPSTAKNLQGETEGINVDFKRTRLDGKETMQDYYFRADDTAGVQYRFVAVDDVVYCLHMNEDNLFSYNTKTRKDTMLAKGTDSVVFNKDDASNPYVYYTMKVTEDIDKVSSVAKNYTQIYRVRADATYEWGKREGDYKSFSVKDGTESYEYTYSFDLKSMEKIAERNDIDFDENDVMHYAYVNLGQIVLDGVGTNDHRTQYNHAEGNAHTPGGYIYALGAYKNGGIYYTRKDALQPESSATLSFYLPESKITSSWNSITGNAKIEDGEDATGNNDVLSLSELINPNWMFYIEEGVHHYLKIQSSNIVRVELNEKGEKVEELIVGRATGANTFLAMDTTSSSTYDYVYYTINSNSGETVGVGRAVFNGTAADYHGMTGTDAYKPATILDIGHPVEWYAPEIIDGRIFFIDGTTLVGEALNTPQVVSLKKDGTGDKVLDNPEIEALNEDLNDWLDVMQEVQKFSPEAANAIHYYYYTGDTQLFKDVIEEFKDKENYGEYGIFSKAQQECFDKYVKGEKFTNGSTEIDFSVLKKGDKNIGLRSYYYNYIGEFSDEEFEELTKNWAIVYLSRPTGEEATGLEAWQWALIGVAIGVGVLGVAAGVSIPLYLHFKKKRAEERANAPKARKYAVDMELNEDIDVYAEPQAAEAEPETAEAEPEAVEAETVEPVEAEELVVEAEPVAEATEEAEAAAEAPEATEEQAPETQE